MSIPKPYSIDLCFLVLFFLLTCFTTKVSEEVIGYDASLVLQIHFSGVKNLETNAEEEKESEKETERSEQEEILEAYLEELLVNKKLNSFLDDKVQFCYVFCVRQNITYSQDTPPPQVS